MTRSNTDLVLVHTTSFPGTYTHTNQESIFETMLVSVLANYQGGPSYSSLVPVQFCNGNQVASLSPDGFRVKEGSVMELDWNHPLVMALQVTRTRPEVQFQTCLRIGTRLKSFYEFSFGCKV
jgi:hypothetical protein